MRNEMIGAVVRRAIEHPEFRQRLIDNPQDALTAHGFALAESDMREIEKISATLGKDGDVEKKLVTMAEEYGVRPDKR